MNKQQRANALSITPCKTVTFRVHVVNHSTIIATYAIKLGNNIETGSQVYENTNKYAMRFCKLDILRNALQKVGEGYRLQIMTDDKYTQRLIETGKIEKEKIYAPIANEVLEAFSLCSSVTCKNWIDRKLFDAALQEYNKTKYRVFPEEAPQARKQAYLRLIKESRNYEKSISNW